MMSWFRPHILELAGYVPGEQPQGGGFIKLNTNENPYPPSPRVTQAWRRAFGPAEALSRPPGHRLPPGGGRTSRRRARHDHRGQGSDDLLTILPAFVGPGDLAAYPTPSYLLYSTLIRLQDGREHLVPFAADWTLDPGLLASPELKLVYLANPNSPSGTALSPDQVAELAQVVSCPLLVDEAYADFADDHCIGLVETTPTSS